jgi:hypothetical protein
MPVFFLTISMSGNIRQMKQYQMLEGLLFVEKIAPIEKV